MNATGSVARLTSDLTRPPGATRADCLRFEYTVHGSESWLNVTIRLTGGVTVTTWGMAGDGTDTWRNATVPIATTWPYQVSHPRRRNVAAQVAEEFKTVTYATPPREERRKKERKESGKPG